MKGLQPIFLGIFGIFAFSWLGMTVVPNLQIGGLNPQTDEDGTDVYPVGLSGMALRGAQVYAANGCFYCHSQQVRPDYGGSDLERGWGQRRSAPRDYIFEPIVMLGKMRTGPDLANVGHRAKAEEKGAVAPSPAPAAGAGAPSTAAAASPATASPAGTSNSTAATAPAPAAGTPAASPATGNPSAANVATTGSSLGATAEELTPDGKPRPYTAAWHHRHLYNARSVSEDSNMPPYRFLYEKQRIQGAASPDAVNFAGDSVDAPESGWEIVPTYDAKCLVAYLMTRDQSHPLKEAKAPATIASASAPALAAEAKK